MLGFEEDLEELVKAMKGWFEIKVRGMIGPEPGDKKEMSIRNAFGVMPPTKTNYRISGKIMCSIIFSMTVWPKPIPNPPDNQCDHFEPSWAFLDYSRPIVHSV